MRSVIIKICVLLSVVSAGSATCATNVSTSILEGLPDNFDTSPFVKVGNKLYHFGQNQVSWYKAFLICRQLGGLLASFDSKEELAALSVYIRANYRWDLQWWLAGTDLDSEGDFYWYNTGERISKAYWSILQPDNKGGNENCVHLWPRNSAYEMNDGICKLEMFYICEACKPKTVVVTVF